MSTVYQAIDEMIEEARKAQGYLNGLVQDLQAAKRHQTLMRRDARSPADVQATVQRMLANVNPQNTTDTLVDLVVQHVQADLYPNVGLEVSPRYCSEISSISIDANDGGAPNRTKLTATMESGATVQPFTGFLANDQIVFDRCSESSYIGHNYLVVSVSGGGTEMLITKPDSSPIGAIDVTNDTTLTIRQVLRA